MSEEEKEAIEQLESWRKFIVKNRDRVNKANDIEFYLRTALNLIKKQQKEIEKKDKITNEMIEEYEYNVRINVKNFCEEEMRRDRCIRDCKQCIIKYFERKVESETNQENNKQA